MLDPARTLRWVTQGRSGFAGTLDRAGELSALSGALHGSLLRGSLLRISDIALGLLDSARVCMYRDLRLKREGTNSRMFRVL